MQGEFRGDVTRDTFHPEKHFLRVLRQQGRVTVDADPNEQSSIIIHYLQSLAVDLMGSHAAPFEDGGFEIEKSTEVTDGFTISEGRYYVNGILCENNSKTSYFKQPYPPEFTPTPPKSPLENNKNYLIYLDVWERHVNYIQDEMSSGNDLQNPSIREVALMDVDTATRSQIVWQVKIKPFTDEELKKVTDPPVTGDLVIADIGKEMKDKYNTVFLKALDESIDLSGRGTGQLKARAKKSDVTSAEPCIVSPSSAYRNQENQLYRVEIHQDGTGKKEGNQNSATFKWSRENSSVVFPIRKLVTSSDSSPTITITLAHLGQDDRFTLKEQDWVEIVDDDYIIQNNPNDSPLFKINSIDPDEQTVVLSGTVQNIGKDLTKHPFLRRWDRDEKTTADLGLQTVEEGKWLALENGIEIWFTTDLSASVYKKGDYWLIPARTATGDVEWPGTVDNPSSLPPHGIVHNYAPLALISVDDKGEISANKDCRRILMQQWK